MGTELVSCLNSGLNRLTAQKCVSAPQTVSIGCICDGRHPPASHNPSRVFLLHPNLKSLIFHIGPTYRHLWNDIFYRHVWKAAPRRTGKKQNSRHYLFVNITSCFTLYILQQKKDRQTNTINILWVFDNRRMQRIHLKNSLECIIAFT